MSHRIALVTDSTCDIPTEWVRQYEIGIVPLTIIFGEQQYLDERGERSQQPRQPRDADEQVTGCLDVGDVAAVPPEPDDQRHVRGDERAGEPEWEGGRSPAAGDRPCR